MKTLRERCITEDIEFIRPNFLDSFRLNPDYEMISESILDLDNLSDVFKSEIAATVDELCHECRINRPDWIFDESTYLDTPHFAMNAT